MTATIHAIDYYLPERVLDNAALAAEFPDWPADKILAKTGIARRRIAATDECSSDLAAKAAGQTPFAFADYPASPVPHQADQNGLFIFLGLELVGFLGPLFGSGDTA